MAGALDAGGEVFVDASGAKTLNPRVQAAYDAVPAAERSRFRGKCAEGGAYPKPWTQVWIRQGAR